MHEPIGPATLRLCVYFIKTIYKRTVYALSGPVAAATEGHLRTPDRPVGRRPAFSPKRRIQGSERPKLFYYRYSSPCQLLYVVLDVYNRPFIEFFSFRVIPKQIIITL